MTPVTFDADSRRWLLTTPASSYGLCLDEDDAPRHLHWGDRLTMDRLKALPSHPDTSSFAGPQDGFEELAVEGGARFGPPSLQVRHEDGSAGVEWRYLDHTVDGGHLAIRLCDRHYPLEVTLHYRVHPDSDAIERWTSLRHTGTAETPPITLLRADSAAWVMPVRPDYRLGHLVGGWGAETQLKHTALPIAETVLTSRRGLTGHQANPWLTVDAGDADEERGEVWSAALAWSGSWRITVARTPGGGVSWTGGFGHEGLRWRLKPGEQWDTPVFAGLYSRGGFGGASRAWHDHTRRHVLPAPGELRPVLYNSWEATGFDVSAENQMQLARAAAELGVELFVMDDGWFGERRNDTAGLGDWTPNPERFPDGLDPLIAEVHRHGMRFGLWVEPEMVNPDSDLYRRHPDWVLHLPNRRRTTLRNQLVLNFARPDVATWAHGWLDRLVTDHAIDFLKWDMNRAFTEAGWPEAGPDADRLWTDHVRQVYAVMDRLRADHPQLRIEACAGGGGRADLGILARTDQVWTSDNTDAADRIAIQHGYSQLLPAQTMSAWVTDSPNQLTGRQVPLRFRFHVAMAGVLGIGGDLLEWTDQERQEAAELVARYKEIRPVVQHGDLHRLGGSAVQYTVADRTVVLAWRAAAQHGTAMRLRLKALDPAARYRDEDTGEEHPGAVLLAEGLPVDLPRGDYASRLVRLARIA